MIIENKETILKAVEYGFDSAFDFKEVPLKSYTEKEITADIKTAIEQGIIEYINSNN